MEAAGDAKDMASIGYGIAYPFGVISVVFFVQLTPRLLKANMDEERKKMEAASTIAIKPCSGRFFDIDPDGFFAFAAAIVVGLLLAKITLPLPGGATFSLGTSGGPLIAGLIFGHFAHIGPINISVNKKLLENMRGLGLILFFAGCRSQRRCRLCGNSKGVWCSALFGWSHHGCNSDVCRFFCGQKAVKALPVQCSGLYLRRYDQYSGFGYSDSCK